MIAGEDRCEGAVAPTARPALAGEDRCEGALAGNVDEATGLALDLSHTQTT